MTLKRPITSQFWAGRFSDQRRFSSFFTENDSYYAEENEDRDDVFLSEFAQTQGTPSFDHDFFEAGFEAAEVPLAEKFRGNSWREAWIDLFDARSREAGCPTTMSLSCWVSINRRPGQPIDRYETRCARAGRASC